MTHDRSIAKMLNLKYPIIQAAMLGVTTPEMVAAVSNSSCLGSLPLGGLSMKKATELVRAVKSLTKKPLAVNLFVTDKASHFENDVYKQMQELVRKVHYANNIPFEFNSPSNLKFNHYSELIPLLISEHVPVVSFTFGILDNYAINNLKSHGIKIIGTATSLQEAKLLEEAGVDAITAQGVEAGGHRGSFLEPDEPPQIGLFSLIPQVCAAVKVPVIAAGGICDRNTVEAAFILGAEAVQIGTLFIPADESAANDAYKIAVLSSKDSDTKLTRAFTGRWARGIKNGFMDIVDRSGLRIPCYNYQNYLTSSMRNFAKQNNNQELMSLWAGQSAGKSRRASTKDIIYQLIQHVENIKKSDDN